MWRRGQREVLDSNTVCLKQPPGSGLRYKCHRASSPELDYCTCDGVGACAADGTLCQSADACSQSDGCVASTAAANNWG